MYDTSLHINCWLWHKRMFPPFTSAPIICRHVNTWVLYQTVFSWIQIMCYITWLNTQRITMTNSILTMLSDKKKVHAQFSFIAHYIIQISQEYWIKFSFQNITGDCRLMWEIQRDVGNTILSHIFTQPMSAYSIRSCITSCVEQAFTGNSRLLMQTGNIAEQNSTTEISPSYHTIGQVQPNFTVPVSK